MATRRRSPFDVKNYYVYDPGVKTEMGGIRVKVDDRGNKYVVMTKEQAEYFMRLGLLGPVPLSQVDDVRRGQIHELTGGRVPRTEGERGTKPKKTARQDPNTMARASVMGINPGTGTYTGDASPEERRTHNAKATRPMFTAYEGLSRAEVMGNAKHGR